MFITTLKCPVCDETLDRIEHQSPQPEAMAIALLGSDSRREHGYDSPSCRADARWMDGWTRTTAAKEEPAQS